MHNYITKIKEKAPFLKNEQFKKTTSGTHFKVFISNNYVIRFRPDNQEILLREASLLKRLNHPLIPKIIKTGKVNGLAYIIEKKLPGKNINILWKKISQKNQNKIISQIVKFIEFMQSSKQKCIYSVSSGKKYASFLDFYLAGLNKKEKAIKKILLSQELLAELLKIIKNPSSKNLFLKRKTPVLAHGDLIIHNLLTDGKKLTGIVDWEMSLFGEKNHDIFRLYYYLECAKDYFNKGKDSSFEFDFLNKLLSNINNSKIIKNERSFDKKYRFVRATFYLHALEWACKSKNPKKNIQEITRLWNKNKI